MTQFEYRLYSVDASYYGEKIRAYLQYKGIPFENVLATREVYRDVILPRVGWPVIPVIVTDDNETLQDTSDMIDYFESKYSKHSVIPTNPALRFTSYLLEFLADEWIKLPAMHYRWCYNYDFMVQELGRNNDPDYPPEKQRQIGEKVAPQFSGWREKLGVNEKTIPIVEENYIHLLHLLDEHFENHDYLLGDTPSLGDFAFFGPMRAHLFRDPASGEIMRNEGPNTCAWLERIHGYQSSDAASEINEPSEVPSSLVTALKHLCKDFVPIVVAESNAFQQWLEQNTSGDIPRYFGTHDVTFSSPSGESLSTTRHLFSYNQYMLQRVLDDYEKNNPQDRQQVRGLAEQIGAEQLLDLALAHRIKRAQFLLVRD